MSDKPAEQAYHARGAAAIREAVEIIEEVYQDLGALRGISPATYNRIIKWREREPGADTGTTPPTKEQILDACERCETCDSRVVDRRTKEVTELFQRSAERGTTPPEGLTREDVERCLKYATILGVDGNPEVSVFMLWDVLRNRAATQRAPVEQIQSNDLDRAHGFLRGRRMPLNMDENEAIHRDLAEQFRQVRATAPDHAREGALREALELAKGALANGSTIDQRYETYKIVCEALGDGKEGGE